MSLPSAPTSTPETLSAIIERLMTLDPASVFALQDIAAERLRQIEGENWTPAHDDAHDRGQMGSAAAAYALVGGDHRPNPPKFWPWSVEWWKPKSPHRNNVRAGALLVAELARHLRSAPWS